MNREISLPYGNNAVRISVPEQKLLGVFEPRQAPPAPDPAATLREALANPVGAPPLRESARGARKVAVAIEDATRPAPNALILDAVMEELRAAEVATERIRVVVATGLHRPMSADELQGALGRWHGKLQIENHDAKDAEQLVFLGNTTPGTAVSINRSFMEADLKITTGDVEYHQFVGYGGGVKCVFPGLADAEAIQANHARMSLPGTGAGRIDGNPARGEIDEVGRMAGVDFNLSVIMDAEHRIVAARAGDPDRSFRQACELIDRMYEVEVPRRAELVIASAGGHPKDIDLYQSQKAIEEATLVVEPRGDVLAFARCEEGSGSPLFEEWMEEACAPEEILQRIEENFVMGGHKAYQIAREVQRARIHLYSEIPPGRVRAWMMNPIRSTRKIDQLIAAAQSVVVLPQATLTMTRLLDQTARRPALNVAQDTGE
jgi:nickel-dependent lactate racemase